MHFVLNESSRECGEGTSILSALKAAGVHIPHLCHDERLRPIGACRLCIVQVDGVEHPVSACSTLVREDMRIATHTPSIEEHRRGILKLMAWQQPAPADEVQPSNEFLRELSAYGLTRELAAHHRADYRPIAVDQTHPYIAVDMARCISCRRCEQICNDLEGRRVWQVWGRGATDHMVPDSGTTLLASSCVSCGACVDTCPSGALVDKTLLVRGTALAHTRTTCAYCGVGCELSVGTREDRIVQIQPVLDAPVSRGHLCVKGRYAFEFVDAKDRLHMPLIREGTAFREVSWAYALDYVAERLQGVRASYGPDAVGVLGSARATNEENYLTQKLARVVLGTNNVDCCARVCHAPSAAALAAMLGAGAATNSFDDIEHARTLLVVGANATESHPIVGARIRQAAWHGAQLIVIDPRRTELAAEAHVHLAPRAGTNVPLLNAMAHTIVYEGLVDQAFLLARVDGYEALRTHLAQFAPETVAGECDVDPADIRRAARLYAGHGPALAMHGLGVTEHVQGTEGVMCIVNLALLTGNLGKVGAGVNPLRGQNNVQGSAHMGCEPHHFPGYALVDRERARFEQAWASPLPSAPGLDLMQMIDAAQAGQLKALYAIGYDILLTNPDATRTREALAKLDLIVVQDMFMSSLARELAHVVLPAVSAFEKDGTFMNGERRVQRVRQALLPRGQARSDREIVCALAAALGHPEGFAFASAEAVWDEVRSVWSAGAGLSYARLEHGGLQWPCPNETHPGTPILHTESFTSGKRALLRCVAYKPTPEQASEHYPFVLITGRKRYQFNAGTMTGRTLNNVFQPGDVLEMAPADADKLALVSGDTVEVRSKTGAVTMPIRVESRMRVGELFCTFHSADIFVNQLTGTQRDSITHAPEYKVTAVRLQKRLHGE